MRSINLVPTNQLLTACFGTHARPKSWWLAQTLLYGLPGNKSSTIGQLRERLQTALQEPKGMVVPEKILNMEVNTNKEFNQLNAQIALKTQPRTSKGKTKATEDPSTLKPLRPKAPAKGKEPKPATKSAPAPSETKATADKKASTTYRKGIRLTSRNTKKLATSRTKQSEADGPQVDAASPSGSDFEGPRTKQTARKTTAGRVPRKRQWDDGMDGDNWPKHEPEWEDPYLDVGPSRKRTRYEPPAGPFGWLTGTYQIEAPYISENWDFCDDLTLVVSIPPLTPHLLLAEFDLGVFHGVMRSRAAIENRPDGAYATFEWCGQAAQWCEAVIQYHVTGMNGYLKFVRSANGLHTVKGKVQSVSGVGEADFDGVWISPSSVITSRWEIYSQAAHEHARVARWRR